MDRKPIVILIEQNILIKNRICQLLSAFDIDVIEVNSPNSMLNLFSQKVRLIITDTEFGANTEFSGVDILSLIRGKSRKVPIIVLSSNGKKEVIMKTMLAGANEYILKPFEDEVLQNKIMKCLDANQVSENSIIKFKLRDYLAREIYKASKGNYSFTLLKVNFQEKEGAEKSNQFYKYADHVYSEIKKVYWEGDTYIPHGYQSHLGFFPFCDEESIATIKNKIDAQFEVCQNEVGELVDFRTSYISACYPKQGESTSELLKIIGE